MRMLFLEISITEIKMVHKEKEFMVLVSQVVPQAELTDIGITLMVMAAAAEQESKTLAAAAAVDMLLLEAME